MSGGIWLALDTATEIASVAAGRPPVAQSGAHMQGARRHAAEIIRLVDFALSRLSIRPADLEGLVVGDGPGSFTGLRIGWAARSEEHTSELQSHSDLVCRLLLEKKKKKHAEQQKRDAVEGRLK